MNLFSYFSFTAAFIYLFIGVYALLRDYKGFVNRLFFFLTIIFSVWALANSIGIAAENKDAAFATYRHFSWVFFLFPAPLFHFSLRVSQRIPKLKSRYIPLLYIPGILLYCSTHMGLEIIDTFNRTDYGFAIRYNRGTLLYYLNMVHYSLFLLASIAVYIHWYRQSKTSREKKQAYIIILTFGISFVLSTIFGTILPLANKTVFPPMAPIFMTIWVFGIGYAILKFKLLYPGPDIAALTILQHINDTVILCDNDTRLIYGNRMLLDLSGYKFNELPNIYLKDLFPSIRFPEALLHGNHNTVSSYLRTKGSEDIPVQLSTSRLLDSHNDTIGYVCTAQDQRPLHNLEAEKEMHRKTAAELRASEEKFMKAFYLSPIGMAILNPETQHIEEMNDSAKTMFGVPKTLSIESVYPFLKWVDPDQRSYFFKQLKQIGRVETFSTSFTRYDNEVLDALVSGDEIMSSELPHLMLYIFDLTQLNQLETDLFNMQKFETVALMAGGIAHDFNNLLTSISGNISLSTHYIDNTPDAQELLSLAKSACNRATELTSKLLSFSKYSRPTKKSIDVLRIIRESLALSVPEKGIKTMLDFDQPEFLVEADEVQMMQVFNNLFINAKHAMNYEGNLTIEVKNYQKAHSERHSKQLDQLLPLADYVLISIQDTGSGIPHEQLQFLFDPYFTTKEKGNGLGLTIVYSIISKHGGDIQVESTPGKGTRFHIYLPITNGNSS